MTRAHTLAILVSLLAISSSANAWTFSDNAQFRVIAENAMYNWAIDVKTLRRSTDSLATSSVEIMNSGLQTLLPFLRKRHGGDVRYQCNTINEFVVDRREPQYILKFALSCDEWKHGIGFRYPGQYSPFDYIQCATVDNCLNWKQAE